MTKFEEELNKIEVEVQTPLEKYIVEKAVADESLYAQHYEAVLEKFKDWHSDEDYQRAKRMVEHVQFENELLKNKLKQQALPVVPECVGNMIEYAKKTEKTIRWFFTEDAYMFPEAMDWYAGSVKGLVDEIYGERQCSLINAFITGKYEVKKPQLFYLKHIDMSKSDAHLNWYLAKGTDNVLIHQGIKKGKLPKLKCILKLTQQEIDSMHAESYEQIPVSVEDGE